MRPMWTLEGKEKGRRDRNRNGIDIFPFYERKKSVVFPDKKANYKQKTSQKVRKFSRNSGGER